MSDTGSLSKKSKRAKTKAEKEEQSENRLFYLVLMVVVGPAIIASSLGTGYYYGALLGLALEAWGIWETPEIHPYLKLIVNWKSRKQTTQFKDSPVKDSNIVSNIQAERDVNIFQVSPKAQPASQPDIHLEMKVGFIAQGKQVVSEPLVSLEVGNRGTFPVVIPSLQSVQIILPDRKYLIPGEDWETDKDFPRELGPGRGFSIWRGMRGFATSLKVKGYSGKVKLRIICKDEASRVFTGGDILLDVDDWAKS